MTLYEKFLRQNLKDQFKLIQWVDGKAWGEYMSKAKIIFQNKWRSN